MYKTRCTDAVLYQKKKRNEILKNINNLRDFASFVNELYIYALMRYPPHNACTFHFYNEHKNEIADVFEPFFLNGFLISIVLLKIKLISSSHSI